MQPIAKTNIPIPAAVRAAKGPSLLAKKIVAEDHLQNCRCMLSLACGIGLDEAFIADHCPINILAVDQNDEILADARLRESERLQFIQHDVTRPFPTNETYDCVYSRNLLHYFAASQQEHLLAEIYKLLNPNGLFVCQLKAKSDYFYLDPHVERREQADGMIYFPSMGYSRNHLDEGEITALLAAAHFAIEDLYLSTEYLYADVHASTLINCFARKA